MPPAGLTTGPGWKSAGAKFSTIEGGAPPVSHLMLHPSVAVLLAAPPVAFVPRLSRTAALSPHKLARSSTSARQRMVSQFIEKEGIKNPRVLAGHADRAPSRFRSADAASQGVCRCGLVDRLQADDLAPLRRRVHDRGARPAADRPRAGDRNGERLPGGRPVAFGQRGLFDRDRRALWAAWPSGGSSTWVTRT